MPFQYLTYGAGGSGSSSVTWENEAIVGVVNGVNVAFTCTSAAVDNDTFNLYLNGVLQYPGALLDYTRAGTAITMNVAPVAPQTLWCTYRSS